MRSSLPLRRIGLRVAIVVLALTALGAASTALASSSALTNFQWSGGTPTGATGAPDWSNSTNWTGGVAPTGSVGTLAFPLLTSPACTGSPTDTCYQGENNIVRLIAHALQINDGVPYRMQGNAMGLGAGGLKAGTTSTTFTGSAELLMPLVLTAAQSWTVDGHERDFQVYAGGSVTEPAGSTHALTIDLNHETFLDVGSNIEVGPITINTTQTTGANSSAVALPPTPTLNATDGNPVSITGAGTGIFASASTAMGALTADAGRIQVGNGTSGAANLSVNGGFTQGSANGLALNVINAGTVAGTDYSQLKATGAVSLAGTLQLSGSTTSGSPTCPTLHVGDVDTLLTTTGTLTGTFAGIPNGATVRVGCGPGTPPAGTINYTTDSITFTVTTAGGPSKLAPRARSASGRSTPHVWVRSGLTSEAVPIS